MSRLILCVLLASVVLPGEDFTFGSRYQVQLSEVNLGRTDVAVVADFNGDGVPDIAVPGYGVGVSILLGKGKGELEQPRVIRVTSCWSLAAADFDGDGNVDLAGVMGNGVFVVRGNGTGGFEEPVFYRAPPTPYRIAVGDMNLDSRPDVLVSDRNANTISVLLNRGDGRLGEPIASPAGVDPTFVVSGDFNGDFVPDAVTVNFSERHASLLAGVGDGTFLPAQIIAEGTGVYNVTAGDFNGDGRLDLAFGCLHEYSYVLLAAEGGGFGSGDWYFSGRFSHLTSGDVDGDGKVDLVGVLRGGTRIVVLKGAGDGHFGESLPVASVYDPSYLVLADVNTDGRLDAVVTSYDAGVVSVVLNGGKEAGWWVGQVTGTARPTASAAGDFDGDGKVDLVVSTAGVSGVWVMRGFGDGTMEAGVRYDAGSTPAAVVTADFNKDGATDIGVANTESGEVAVLLNKGDGTFLPARVVVVSGCSPAPISAADFTGDGIADLALGCREATTLLILPGKGDGTFGEAVTFRPGNTILKFAVGDFNKDGTADIAVLGGGLALYLGNGDGSFRGPVSLPSSNACSDVVAGDWNGDAAADLAIVCPGLNGIVSVFLNSGSGTFRRLEFEAQASAGLLATGDFTGDGRTDLLVHQQPQVLATYAGSGDGTFAASAALGVPSIGPLTVADLNNDGRADLVLVDLGAGRVQLFATAPGGSGLEPPVPLSPVGKEAVAQNNPMSSCPSDPIRGAGIRLQLQWTPVVAAGVVVVVEHSGAASPVWMASTTSAAFTLLQLCTFYPDGELEGWWWRIRSVDAIGNLSRWSERAEFRLSPCRLSDGRLCGTTGPPPPVGQVPMSTARVAHTATLLRNGKVLVTGGNAPLGSSVVSLQTAEVYDPATRSFVSAGRMQNARAYHTATLLADGRVLLAGGMTVTAGQPPVPVSTLEIYDPKSGTFRGVGAMTARNGHTATLLRDSRVLLAGGLPGQGSFLNLAEIFQPATNAVSAVMPMLFRRGFHTATLLPDGRVVVIGGEGINPELFVPSSNTFVASPAGLGRINHTATLLGDGRVLAIGGLSSQGPALGEPVVFDAVAGTIQATGAMMANRTSHAAVALRDGRVLILGGQNMVGDSLGSSEIYVPAARSFTAGPALATPRTAHTATMLSDGTVLVIGGFRTSGGTQSWLGTGEIVEVRAGQ
ncbi:MAG: FG-GAP-like repeat-containing protein [Bryobacteraceae bacterium]